MRPAANEPPSPTSIVSSSVSIGSSGPGKARREGADEEPAGGGNDQVRDQAHDLAPGHECDGVATVKCLAR